jgi:GH18 family chitinase
MSIKKIKVKQLNLESNPEMTVYWAGWGNPVINIVRNTPTLPGGKSAISRLMLGFGSLEFQNGLVVIDTQKSGYFDKPETQSYKTWQEYRQKFPETKILLGIGGHGNNEFFYRDLTGRIAETVQAIAKKVEDLGLDGVELDPEYHAQGEENRIQGNINFAKLAIELRRILPKEKQLGWDVFGWSGWYRSDKPEADLVNNQELLKVFDHVQIMAYHDDQPYQARLAEWEKIIKDKKKLILGHRIGEHSAKFMKERSDYVKRNGYGGAFPWALSPECDRDREPGISFFDYLRSIYAGLQGWALEQENIEKLSEKPKDNEIAPVIAVYFGGWANRPIPDTFMNSIYPSFAHMEKSGSTFYSDYKASGNFHEPSDRGSYKTVNDWTRKYFDRGARSKVAYGGGKNHQFRKYVIDATDQELDSMAGEIKANIKKYYFSGVDLDIEHWWDHSKEENLKFGRNIAKLVKILRRSLDEDPQTKGAAIDMAVGFDAAGKVEGISEGTYTGTMLPLFQDQDAMKAIGHINIMSYGSPFDQQEIVSNLLDTFSKAVPREKICFGFFPLGHNPPMSPEVVESHSRFLKDKCGGAFLWAIDEYLPNPAVYIHAMKRGFGVLLAPEQKAILKYMEENLTEKVKGIKDNFDKLKKITPHFLTVEAQKSQLEMYRKGIMDHVFSLAVITKLKAGKAISKEECEKFVTEMAKELPEQLDLLQIYIEAIVKRLIDSQLINSEEKQKTIYKYVNLIDIISGMKKGVSDESYKEFSNAYQKFVEHFSVMLKENVEIPSEKLEEVVTNKMK